MDRISASDFSCYFSDYFSVSLLCRFKGFTADIDESTGATVRAIWDANSREGKVIPHYEKNLDYCLNISGTAYNQFDDIPVEIRISFKSDVQAHAAAEYHLERLIERKSTVIVSGSNYFIHGDAVHFYDPKYHEINIPFDMEISNGLETVS